MEDIRLGATIGLLKPIGLNRRLTEEPSPWVDRSFVDPVDSWVARQLGRLEFTPHIEVEFDCRIKDRHAG